MICVALRPKTAAAGHEQIVELLQLNAWKLKMSMREAASAREAVYGRRLAEVTRKEREQRWRGHVVWWRTEHPFLSYAMLCRYFAGRRAWLLGTVASLRKTFCGR